MTVTRIAGRGLEQSMYEQFYLTAGTGATRRIAGTLSASIGNSSARWVLGIQLGIQLGKQLGKQLCYATCFDFFLSSPSQDTSE